MSLFLNLGPGLVTPDMIREVRDASGVSSERAFAELVGAYFDLDTTGRDRTFFRDYLLPSVFVLSPEIFRRNSYYERVRHLNASLGDWTFESRVLPPYEAFVCGDLRVFPDGKMLPQVGFFEEEYRYPAALENGREWMTLLPNETITTDPAVASSFGKVRTYGLGLGYFAVSSALRKEVVSVTVVEKAPEAIRLFESEILPLFPEVRDKITCVCEDAYQAAAEMSPGDADFVFADIWHDVSDGREAIRKLKALEGRSPGTVFRYWLEETVDCYERPELWP